MTTIIYGGVESIVGSAKAEGADLWIDQGDLPGATGWHLEPQGLCMGETCVPVPEGAGWVSGERFNLSALSRHLGQPAAAAPEAGIWVFAPAPETEPATRPGEMAPNFSLPDVDGALHALSDYRGHKVLLLSWASW